MPYSARNNKSLLEYLFLGQAEKRPSPKKGESFSYWIPDTRLEKQSAYSSVVLVFCVQVPPA